jgi:putative ABC transport system permease protein
MLDGIGNFSNNPKIALHFLGKNSITKPYTVSGEKFDPNEDGIWIDDRFAKLHDLSVGDTMSVNSKGITFKKVIKGTVYNPEYVYFSDGSGITPDFSGNTYAYLSADAFPKPKQMVYNEIMLTTNKSTDKLEEKVSDALKGNYSVFITRENQSSYNMFDQEIHQHKAMGSIFPIAFLAIALLTMMTTMTRIVTAQRTQIGTLKAIGFKKNKILWHYISYGLWLSSLGSILGAILGLITIPKLFYPSLSRFYTLPEWKPAFDISFCVMGFLTVFLSTLVTWLSCKNLLK